MTALFLIGLLVVVNVLSGIESATKTNMDAIIKRRQNDEHNNK